MNKKEFDKRYYEWLEDKIKKEKETGIFFPKGSSFYEKEIDRFLKKIEKTDPKFLDKLIFDFVDTSKFNLSSDFDMKSFAADLKKGSVVKWLDKEGREFFYINKGRHPVTKERQLLLVTTLNGISDINFLKKALISKILKKDIEKVYDKIKLENKVGIKKNKKAEFFKNIKKSYSQEDLENISNSFERKFKKLIRESGSSLTDVKEACKDLFKTLPKGEQRDIAQTFKSYSNTDLNNLLIKWKNEALGVTVTHTMSKKQDIGYSR